MTVTSIDKKWSHPDWCDPDLCAQYPSPVTDIPTVWHLSAPSDVITDEDGDVVRVQREQFQCDAGLLSEPRVRLCIADTAYHDGHVSLSLDDAEKLVGGIETIVQAAKR